MGEEKLIQLDLLAPANQPLADAVENNLVNILSCDNASWDTPEWGFQKSLEELEKLVP